MSQLGQSFPASARRDHVLRQLVPGRVLYLLCDFTDPPKEKFLVLASRGTTPLLFVINSGLRPFVRDHPARRACQVCIASADHDFLRHDSFIDCINVVDSMTEEEIVDQVVNDLARVKGILSSTTRLQVLEIVGKSRTISRAHKARIISSL